MKYFIYPHSESLAKLDNPYIDDFVYNLKKEGCIIINKHRSGNPLFPLLSNLLKTDVFVFHWLENVPLYKHGNFQYIYAVFSIFLLKLFGKKIIWFKHNKKPHGLTNKIQGIESRHLIYLLKKNSTHIFTHSKEGLELLKKFSDKSTFLMHPTKDRLQNKEKSFKHDILIWGNISKYKGVYEFLKIHKANKELNKVSIRIIGRCKDEVLAKKINNVITKNVQFENRHINFNELKSLYGIVKYVLVPYKSETVLSSAVLMDSLSMGFSVIGPNTAVFKELSYDKRINVLTYNELNEIPEKIYLSKTSQDYKAFLDQYNWSSSIKKIIAKIEFVDL